jgi:hypothetical protein
MTTTNLTLAVTRESAWARPVRADERFPIETAACWRRRGDSAWRIGLVTNVSLGGLGLDLAEPNTLRLGETIDLRLPRVGEVAARVVRATDDVLGLSFDAIEEETRDRLVQLLFGGRA